MFSMTATKRLPHEHNSEQRQVFLTILDLTDSAPTKPAQFYSVLQHLDKAIQITYQDQSIPEVERGSIEKQMFISCEIPRTLLPVIADLLKTSLPHLLDEIDPAALYFRDFAWLGLTDDQMTKAWLKRNPVDVMRKTPLGRRGRATGELVRLRRCIRCASLMEDFVVVGPTEGNNTAAGTGTGSSTVPSRTGQAQAPAQGRDPFWMASLQKMCHCGNMWMILD